MERLLAEGGEDRVHEYFVTSELLTSAADQLGCLPAVELPQQSQVPTVFSCLCLPMHYCGSTFTLQSTALLYLWKNPAHHYEC